ncbi:SMP-30/gluconolactonase/LRE family protein [Dyella silvatica]|uniref:SMP-30/gluconolactonase/LRE family protein n=1 Tax=Dyella silvatica TaxID=2992128 RepID=UPI002253298A|nr:SMP-30/gluconolactonase/LRE family protein [Dyella silvatica]
MSLRAEALLAANNTLGEGIVWCDRTQTLFWTDIHAATLWSYRPTDGSTRQWPMPERLASFALCEADGWLLLGLASRLAFFHLDSHELRPIIEVEAELPTRLNDGACDRHGRFVFGTLHEPVAGDSQRPLGGFYRLHADLKLQRLPLGDVAISNSIAFSPGGDTMYYCDSPTRRILCCDYGDVPSQLRTFVDLQDIAGEPDGSTIDALGGLWTAQWGMGRVVRYRPDGSTDTIVELAAHQPTRPAFGGAKLDQLYITSARAGLDEQALANDALAGALFQLAVPFAGLPEPRFAGSPEACLPRPA